MAARRQTAAVRAGQMPRTGRSTAAYGRRTVSAAHGTAAAPYVYGTAAVQPEVYTRPDEEQRSRRSRTQSARQDNRIRRNQERAMYMDLPYVILLTIASICTLYLCVNYLHVQSSITARMHNIESLETKLEQMKAENDALETSINTSIDLNEIYETATKELGMVYANKDQVLLYDKTESEYVRQYEDIPEYK